MALLKLAVLSCLAVFCFVLRSKTFVECTQINPLQQPDVISTFNVHNHYQCQRLCWYSAQCARYSFHSADTAEGHNCVLHVNTGTQDELLEGWREESAIATGMHSDNGCLLRPCSNTEMCLPSPGQDNFICVHYPNLLNTPSTAALTTPNTIEISTVPVTTTSTVPVTTTNTVSETTTNTVSETTTSTVPVTTTSTVPVTTTNTVSETTTSTVPETTTSTVPVTTTSTVPVTTTSSVPVIEKTCTMDQDCPAGTNTDCYQGLCLCAFGFQYSVSRDTCVDFSACEGTDPALTTYLTYPGGGIIAHNDYATYGTLEECRGICTSDSTCHNFERESSSDKCFYQSVGPTPDIWGPDSGWVFYQKNCA